MRPDGILMKHPSALFRLLGLLHASLAMYVADAGIWSYPGDEAIKLALVDLVGDHKNIVERAGTVLEQRHIHVPRLAYPIHFTATHDTDLRSLLPRILNELRKQLVEIDEIIESLSKTTDADPLSLELALEARDTTLGHSDVLGQLLVRQRA